MKTNGTHSEETKRKIAASRRATGKTLPSGTCCAILFGKAHSDLTDEERVIFHRYMRKLSYYRRHEENKARQREEKRDKKGQILAYLGWEPACMDCGYDVHLAALDFHHEDPDAKEDCVTQMPLRQAVEEARKCRLVCSNCHRIIHARENRPGSQKAGRPRQHDLMLDRLLDAYGLLIETK